jgi:hypothetical protein
MGLIWVSCLGSHLGLLRLSLPAARGRGGREGGRDVCRVMAMQVGALLFDQINVAQQCLDAHSDLSDPSVPPVSLLIRDAKQQFDIKVLTGTRVSPQGHYCVCVCVCVCACVIQFNAH